MVQKIQVSFFEHMAKEFSLTSSSVTVGRFLSRTVFLRSLAPTSCVAHVFGPRLKLFSKWEAKKPFRRLVLVGQSLFVCHDDIWC